jgi:hypothetical protein
MPHRYRHRQGKRHVGCELRQPLGFLRRLRRRPRDAWQPHGQLLTQPVNVVVGPVRGDQLDRQLGPLRELAGEQAADERRVGRDLIGMHPLRQREVLSGQCVDPARPGS